MEILIDGEIACNPKVIVNKFNDFFINIGPTLAERTKPPKNNESVQWGNKYAHGLVVLNKINMDRTSHLWWEIL